MNMAITINGLKGLAGRMTEKVTGKGGGDQTTLIMQTVRKLADKEPGKVPLIGSLPVEKQYLYTGGTLIVSLLLVIGMVIMDLAIPRLVQRIIDQGIAAGSLEIIAQTFR